MISLGEVVMQRKVVVMLWKVVVERLMLKVVVVVGRMVLKVAEVMAARAKIGEVKVVNQQGEKEVGMLVLQVVMLSMEEETMEEKEEEHQEQPVVTEEVELKN